AAESALAKLSPDPMAGMIGTSTAQKLLKTPDASQAFSKAVATNLASQLEKKAGYSIQYQILAKLQWSIGDKDAAKASAAKAVELAKSPEGAKTRTPVAPFEKFAEALGKDEMPTDEQFSGWLRESRPQARQAATVVPKETTPKKKTE
ncbi:MAG TPA: hypothetical protein VGE67_04055, partial [Haloferula sp.]